MDPIRGYPRSRTLVALLSLLLALALVAGCDGTPETGGDGDGDGGAGVEEPTGGTDATGGAEGGSSEGAQLVQDRCTACHSLTRVEQERADRARWTEIVDSMIDRGAQLNASERETVIDYLAETYPDD